MLDCVEVDPEGAPRHTVIWLHGLGADGHDFEPIVPAMRLPAVRFVFPHAPAIPVSINNGFVMPAWYDIRDADLRHRHDEDGIRASAERIEELITAENARGVPSERLVLAGFSQGGALALHVALRHPRRLLGVIALSTYMVCEESVEAERHDANRQTPVFQAHGTHDPLVLIDRGEAARDRLLALGHAVDWHTYPMDHAVCPEEIDAVAAWLLARFESE